MCRSHPLLWLIAVGLAAFSHAQPGVAQDVQAPATLPQIVNAASVCLSAGSTEDQALAQIAHAGWQEKHWADLTGKHLLPNFHLFSSKENNAILVETGGFCVIRAVLSKDDSFERVKHQLDTIPGMGSADHDQATA